MPHQPGTFGVPADYKTENILREADHRDLPKTVRVIYLYHYFTGDWGDLIGFQNRYPFYSDSFNLKRAVTVAQLAPDLDLGFTDDRKDAFERYIELGAPTQKPTSPCSNTLPGMWKLKTGNAPCPKSNSLQATLGKKTNAFSSCSKSSARPPKALRPQPGRYPQLH